MPTDEVVLMSTSDSEAQVRAALKLPEPKPEATPVVTSPAEPVVAATPPVDTPPVKVEAKDKTGSPKAEERIATLTKERYEAQARIDELEKQLKGKETQTPPADGTAQVAGKAAAKTFDKPRPKQSDFEDFDKYIEATMEWTDERATFNAGLEVERQLEVQRREAWEADMARQRQAQMAQWYKRVDEARGQFPDYEDMMKAAHLDVAPNVIPGISAYTFNEENGAVVGYFLAKNPAEFDRIARLPYGAQISECGKLDAKIQAGLIQLPIGAAPTAKTETPAPPDVPAIAPSIAPAPVARPAVSAAPLPPPRVGGGGGAAAPASLDKIAQGNDYQAFKHARNASRVGGGRPH